MAGQRKKGLFQLAEDDGDFTGRSQETDTIEKILKGDSPTAMISAVSGMGGVGKSVLARHVGNCSIRAGRVGFLEGLRSCFDIFQASRTKQVLNKRKNLKVKLVLALGSCSSKQIFSFLLHFVKQRRPTDSLDELQV